MHTFCIVPYIAGRRRFIGILSFSYLRRYVDLIDHLCYSSSLLLCAGGGNSFFFSHFASFLFFVAAVKRVG